MLRKLFGSVGVVFKGSGFYRNDSRADAKKPAAAESKPTESKSGEKKSTSSSSDSKSSSTTAKAS
jgi:hypothetical protein